jgi:hypothetical protein
VTQRILLLGLTLLLAGCSSCNRDEQSKPSSSLAIVNPRLEPIPTEEDFEEEAIRDIKSDQLDAELERLAKEIKP